jgi:hypothetical protein
MKYTMNHRTGGAETRRLEEDVMASSVVASDPCMLVSSDLRVSASPVKSPLLLRRIHA